MDRFFISILREQGENLYKKLNETYESKPENYLYKVADLLLNIKELSRKEVEEVRKVVDTFREYYLKYPSLTLPMMVGNGLPRFYKLDAIIGYITLRKKPCIESWIWKELYDELKEIGGKIGWFYGVTFPSEQLNQEIKQFFECISPQFKQKELKSALSEDERYIINAFISLVYQGSRLIESMQQDMSWMLSVLEEETDLSMNKLLGFYKLIENLENRLIELKNIKDDIEELKDLFLSIVESHIPLLKFELSLYPDIYSNYMCGLDRDIQEDKVVDTVKYAVSSVIEKFNNVSSIEINVFTAPLSKALQYLLENQQNEQGVSYEREP